MLTSQVSRYCLLALRSSIVILSFDSGKLHMSDQLPVGNSMMQSNSLQPWSSYRSGQNQSFMSSTGMLQPSHTKEIQPHSLETSPGVIALLQDKIDAQAKVNITTLSCFDMASFLRTDFDS